MFPPDLIEERIASMAQAEALLHNRATASDNSLRLWYQWYEPRVRDKHVRKLTKKIVTVAYARMALRNGSLSLNPTSYHSEKHIDDLFKRLIKISALQESSEIPDYGWTLLSLFVSCHDLRQSETPNVSDCVGSNEQASFQELLRLLEKYDTKDLITKEHRNVLKLMIHGSTFGRSEDNRGNIYNGKLLKYLLVDNTEFSDTDIELAYIACDIDTANVAADLKDYARSSINVYNEIQNVSPSMISARKFFGEQQEQFFFELQKFDSKLCGLAFEMGKEKNAPLVKQISQKIKQLDNTLTNDEVVKRYVSLVKSLA